MNFAEYSITHKVISWMFTFLLLIGGTVSFFKLGQLELPEFTIKQALVITAYPGASPEQVEEEVTLPIEDALQQLEGVKHITSVNSAGLSQIEIEMAENFGPDELPQIWDEVRRKVNNNLGALPPGTMKPKVIDDFGDVYGLLLNLTGEGYSDRELQNYSDFLRRELVLIEGVKKVTISGKVMDEVVVEISQEKLNVLGLDRGYIYSIIQRQNVVSNAGSVRVGDNRIRIHPTGEFDNIAEMKRLLISPPNSSKLIYLGDIANIYKDTEEKPDNIYHSFGKKSLSIGISFSSGINVVDVGTAVNNRIIDLSNELPIGMMLNTVYDQSKMVDETVSGFLINLAESIGIVIVVLLIFMGLRSGLLMGLVLLLSILGTFIVMNVLNIELQIISLGALIIALGMLVDNAIVVTEGILIGIKLGKSRFETAKQVISQTQWPLLGATIIAIMAFAPIGLTDTATGEFCRSLFQVLFISLFISWIVAMTLTPFFCYLLFKDGVADEQSDDDPYKGLLFIIFRQILNLTMRFRWITLGLIVLSLITAIIGFGNVKQVFFPASNTPIFFVNVWMPEGSDIKATEQHVSRLEADIIQQQADHNIGLVNLSSVIGQGAQRFNLSYMPEKAYSAYGQIIIEMMDLTALNTFMRKLERELIAKYPQAEYRFKYMENGPAPAAKLEARFFGDEPKVLRQLAAQTTSIFDAEPTAVSVRHNWRNQVTLIRPQISLAQARETGISKRNIDDSLLVNFSGKQIGIYREGSHLLPIIARAPASERLDADSISKVQVWSSNYNVFVPLTQVVSSFDTEWENPLIMRRDRKRVITVLADPVNGQDETSDSVLNRVKADIEAIPLPAGYEFEWGGEREISLEAEAGVFSSIPLGFLAMFIITIVLFNSLKQAVVIWFTVPLAMIGVTSGLLLFNAPFSFMAMLGVLSLNGMIIKNGIVLVDQINVELKKGKPPLQAVMDSTISRVRPVLMAAITTMLGMLPLLNDAFFGSMAITIIFGLGFASVLTLIVLPVAYTLMFRIPSYLEQRKV
ncbi:efflux RND transporter permease subunit [Vibrio casei]|uniref:AcrB/AcrD/AcrF family protein n=1 Tax=Vibrio casei TaxID=673372 RepID=A0A368LMW9_9VIBR|nr:efflux RND transporter permease subunit [Vibrio casei]RCS73155.1 AcrB/AcrD/AcrF family protein [Vibrio casei]SJN41086.1 Acriflavin resistance protein [Vibrio casei]